MNATESIIYVTLSAHRWTKAGDIQPGAWTEACSCLQVVEDHDEHVAKMIHDALLPDAQKTPSGRSWDQLPLVDVAEVDKAWATR